MASAWGSAWANAWGNSWGSVQQETVVIIGGDDAPGARRRKKRKESHELYTELEQTVHELLQPQTGNTINNDVLPEPAGDVGQGVDDLLLLAQGQHERLQHAAALRAELRSLEAAREAQRLAALQQDDDEMMMLS